MKRSARRPERSARRGTARAWWIFALRGVLALAIGLGYEFSAAGYFVLSGFHQSRRQRISSPTAALRGARQSAVAATDGAICSCSKGLVSLALGVGDSLVGHGHDLFIRCWRSWALGTGML